MAVTVSFSLVLGAVILLFPHQVFRLFSQDAKVLAMASSYAPVAALCFLGAGLRSPAIAFVNGIGATSMNYIMGIMDGVVMRIGLAWLLGNALNFGIDGYWYGSAIAGFTFFVVGAPYYWSGIWKTEFRPAAHNKWSVSRIADAPLSCFRVSKSCSVIYYQNLSIDCLRLIAGKEQNGIGLIYYICLRQR